MANAAANYRIGTIYSLVTIALLATQHPFSLLAAERFSVINFICATQVILMACVPMLLRTAEARRDFRSLISRRSHLKKFFVILLIGLANHVLYFLALSRAHPITIAAVLNLSPFWGAMVALVVTRKSIPTSYPVFFGCLVFAFLGAMMIAFSQTKDFAFTWATFRSLSPYWAFAIPVPILFALSGTLIGKWFSEYDEMASIAVTFVTASVVLIPLTVIVSVVRSDIGISFDALPALGLLAVGTVLGAGVALVVYQISLSVTNNDNGFVSMFFLLGPALTGLLSLAMSPFIPQLRFEPSPLFFAGLLLVAIPIFIFSWATRKRAEAAEAQDSDPTPRGEPELASG